MTRTALINLLQGLAGIAVITVGACLLWSVPVGLIVLGALLLIDRIT